MKYFLIAGEASGDMHGANLIQSLIQKDPHAEFKFWGGDKMQAKAADGLLVHFKDVAIMGFIEVLMKLKTIAANLSLCKQQILDFKPDVIVLIDYPGFNLKIAEWGKANGFKVCYYISPKVWAWNEKRAFKLEKFVDTLLLIFPFEVDYFKKWKVNTVFVGNPLLDEINQFKPDVLFYKTYKLDESKKIIALLPGSRKQEIKRILPQMIEATEKYSDYQLVIAGAPSISSDFYAPYLNKRVHIVFNQTYDILNYSTAAIVCSGTATLETALFNVPQVCGYVANYISYKIAMAIVKVKYISLVNLNLDKYCIAELLQHQFSVENIQQELEAILPNGNKRVTMLQDYKLLKEKLGTSGASDNAATEILKMLTT